MLLAVIAAGFVVTPEPLWAMLFYLGVLLPWLWHSVARRHQPPRLSMAGPGELAGVALIGWFTLTTLWDHAAGPQLGAHLIWLWNGLNTLAFFLVAAAVLRAPASRERLTDLLIGFGLLNIASAVLHLLVVGGVAELRMNGWAETRHPILGAAMIGLCVILAAARLLQRRQVWMSGAMLLAGMAFILATGSRGPLFAVLGGLAVLLLGQHRRLLAAAGGLTALLLVAGFAVPGAAQLVQERLLARGWSNRLDIWRLAVAEIGRRPLFGYGPSARLDRAVDNFPHDLFLSTLFYSGAVGLLLLLLLFAAAARAAWRARGGDRWTLLALLANTLLNGVSDLSQVTKGPSPMWYIFWLPVVLALSRERQPPGSQTT